MAGTHNSRIRTALDHGRHGDPARASFGNRAQFWLDLQSRHDIAVVESERGAEIARRAHPADAA